MSQIDVRVPAIGGFKDVGVIDVLVKPGDAVKVDDSLITLESDKATMDVPSPFAGTVKDLRVHLGDRIGEGSIILTLEPAGESAAKPAPAPTPSIPSPPEGEGASAGGADGHLASQRLAGGDGAAVPVALVPEVARSAVPARVPAAPVTSPPPGAPAIEPLRRGPVDTVTEVARPGVTEAESRRAVAHASPSVRKAARELGVELARVAGSGPRGRILQADVHHFVKQALRGAGEAPAGRGGALDLLPWPRVDFASFGPVETRPLPRIRKISGANLARNWVMIPHVTQFDEADVTELEAFRVQLNQEHEKDGVKVTLLAFLVKAGVAALRRFPELNASLDGDSLVLKRYFHIGFAADTPNGLVVPVLRNADQKGVLEIARELADLSARARAGKLGPAEMSGGSFSISSLGGIGGTAFTPIINAPEVAVLGVSRIATRPVWDGQQFAPRRMLPLSLSYDHRVIDGATAARFTAFLAQVLADLRRAML